MTKLADLKRCPSCHSADIIDNGHPTFPWRCVSCDWVFVTPYVMSAAPATPAATPPGSLEEWLEAHRVTLDERQLFVVKSFIVLNYLHQKLPAPAQPQRESEALAKFKGLAKEFRREASRWKKLDTSIAEGRQDAFNECASDIEAAVKALEQQRESEQPEQELREAVQDMMPLIELYAEREINSPANHQEFARQTKQKLYKLRAALSPQTDSQETP